MPTEMETDIANAPTIVDSLAEAQQNEAQRERIERKQQMDRLIAILSRADHPQPTDGLDLGRAAKSLGLTSEDVAALAKAFADNKVLAHEREKLANEVANLKIERDLLLNRRATLEMQNEDEALLSLAECGIALLLGKHRRELRYGFLVAQGWRRRGTTWHDPAGNSTGYPEHFAVKQHAINLARSETGRKLIADLTAQRNAVMQMTMPAFDPTDLQCCDLPGVCND